MEEAGGKEREKIKSKKYRNEEVRKSERSQRREKKRRGGG